MYLSIVEPRSVKLSAASSADSSAHVCFSSQSGMVKKLVVFCLSRH